MLTAKFWAMFSFFNFFYKKNQEKTKVKNDAIAFINVTNVKLIKRGLLL